MVDGFRTTRKLRVGFLIDHFDSKKGGMEWALSELFHYLVKQGHSVHLFAIDWEEDPDLSISCHSVRVQGSRARREIGFVQEGLKAARNEGCDVVVGMRHCPGVDVYYPHGGVFRYAWKRKIATWRPFWLRWAKGLSGFLTPKNMVFRLADKAICEADDPTRDTRVIAVSRLVRDTMVSYYGAIAGWISVVYNGVDSERFRPAAEEEDLSDLRGRLGIGENDTVFLFVGHNFRLKGLEWLLRAGGIVAKSRSDFKIVVLGRDDAAPYKRIASKAGLADRAVFVGEVPDPERYYRVAHAFALPTYHDPCSLATLEAMASGLPFITTRYNGSVTLTMDGRPPDFREGVILEEPADIRGIADAMLGLFDAEKRQPMAESVRKYAEYYPWEKTFQAVERVLVLSADPGSASESASTAVPAAT